MLCATGCSRGDSGRQAGIEGVIAKGARLVYEPSRRSSSWIVIGWKASGGRREGTLGPAAACRHNDNGELDYLGGVGTGFTAAARDLLADLMRPLARPR